MRLRGALLGAFLALAALGGVSAQTIQPGGGGGSGTITAVNPGTGVSGGGSSGAVTVGLAVPVAAANGGAGTITGALKGNGAGVVSQAACADLSNATLCATSLTNGVTLGNVAQIGANTVLGNATAGTANIAAQAMPSCSAATNGLIWTPSTGFGCNSAINAATLGGANFAAPGAIGGTTPAAGAFSTLSASGAFTSNITGGGVQCVTASNTGVLSGTGSACGSGGGGATITGTPASGNLAKFSGAASITNGDLSGDCTTAGTLAITCTKTSGVAFAASATTDTTSASNISAGTLAAARGGAGTITGALKGNGAGVVSQAACADLSNATLCATSLTNGVTLGNVAQIGANTVLGNATAGTANIAAQAMPSCSAATNGLIWTPSTGFGCNSAINAATLGGATFAAPGTIGGTTPGAATHTTLTVTSTLTTNVTGGGVQCLQASNTGVVSGTAAACGSGGSTPAYVTAAAAHSLMSDFGGL